MLDLVGVQEVGWDSGGTENSHTHISLEKEWESWIKNRLFYA
jgi:hypothetical protein